MVKVAAILILLIASLHYNIRKHSVRGDPTLSGQPNEYWRCTGCKSEIHAKQLFGHIREAIHREDRLSFLVIDVSWIPSVLDPDAIVHVTVLNASQLGSYIAPTPPIALQKGKIYFSDQEVVQDEVQIIVSEFNGFLRTWSVSHSRLFHNYVKAFNEVPLFPAVDEFLLRNPCWLPIYEPFSKKGSSGKSLISHGSDTPGMRNSRRLQGSKRNGGAKQREKKLLVLIRLPAFQYYPTCKLYTQLTHIQHPKTCVYDDSHTAVHHLGNIGYTHTYKALLNSFVISAMIEKKLFIAPQSETYMARRVEYFNPLSGINISSKSAWSWAEPSTCPSKDFLHDPWSCNFLSLTNCSDRHKTQSLKVDSLHLWETPTRFLRGDADSLNITTELRMKHGDGPLYNEEQWTISRMNSYVQRPNQWLRYLIKKSLQSILPLSSQSTSEGNGGGGIIPATVGGQDEPILGSTSTSSCIAMHVRHGDATVEELRKNSGVDRSFVSHIRHARNLTRSLGVHKIFLATDNLTVVEEAATLYPEYTWYVQRRPMSSKVEMFLMFTKPFASEDSITTGLESLPVFAQGGGGNDLTLGGVQADLSHVLADVRFSARCVGIVGAFDSALTYEMYRTMCTVGARGRGKCPPSIDLREVAKQ